MHIVHVYIRENNEFSVMAAPTHVSLLAALAGGTEYTQILRVFT